MNASPEFQRLFGILESADIVIRQPELGEVGTFFLAASNGASIVIDPNDFKIFINDPKLLVSRIGHEIAHALDSIHTPALLGADGLTVWNINNGNATGPSNSGPADYSNSRGRDEGIAVTTEYFIARELGIQSVSLGDEVFSRLNNVYESMRLAGRSEAEIHSLMINVAGSYSRSATPSTNQGLDDGLTYHQVDTKTYMVSRLGFVDASGKSILPANYPASYLVNYVQNDDGSYVVSGIDPKSGELVTKFFDQDNKAFQISRSKVDNDGSRHEITTDHNGVTVERDVGSDGLIFKSSPVSWFQRFRSDNWDPAQDNVGASVLPPPPPPPPGINDYLANNHLTTAQESALAAALDRQHLGGASGISFIGLPDGSTMLQNADGDIVGQLNLQSDGALRWSGIGGERSFIQPSGDVQDQATADRYAADAASADAHNAAQTAGAVGLLNAVVGLQHWDAMNDVQRAASVVAIYNIVDKLNGGELPGKLGSAAAALGLFSALERGDIGGSVYSGLSLVEAATSTAETAGLVSQTFGGSFLPALGMVLAIQSGDPVAMASSGLALLSSMSMIGPWGAAAGAVLTLANMMFGNDDIPTREGLAHAQWDADGHLQIVTDLNTEGGGASAASWMRGMAEGLQARLAGSGSSLVPGLLPAIGYCLDPDGPAAAHGAPGFVYLQWIDTQGQPQTRYYDGQGNRNDGSGETLAGDFMRHAADAVAPDWAVATALAHWQSDQTQGLQRPHLPNAAMPEIDTDGLHQTLHALVLGGLAEARAAQLDTDGDGFLERSQWLGRQQSALALDADGNGVIDAGELVDTRGGGRTDLDWLDANRDGILDSRDPAFAALRLWVDADADGRSKTDGAVGTETRTLAEAGIVAVDFRTDPPTAMHADGSREVFGVQRYVGDVLGNRYDPVEGGVLQRMEQADGSVLSQLLAVNTHAFDGQIEHMHEGQNVGGGASTVEAGDSRLVSTGANTTASTNRRTTTTLAAGDVRIEAGSAGTARTGQAGGPQPSNGPPVVVRNSGERGIAVIFADAATGTGAAMRDATAAMVRSAESGTLAGSSGAGLLGVVAAGMAAWPALADAEPAGSSEQAEPLSLGLPMSNTAASFNGESAGRQPAPAPQTHDRSRLRDGTGFGGDVFAPSMADSVMEPGANAAELPVRSNPAFPPSTTQPSASQTSDDASPDHHADTTTPTPAPPAATIQLVRPAVVGEEATDAEDTVQRWSAASLLANDQNRNTLATDAAGLHISAVFAPRHGSVSLQADAAGVLQVVFVPETDYHGEAGFSYAVTDAFGLQSRAEMVLHITPVNDAPVTRDETASSNEDQALFFRVGDLLANDHDVDGEVDGDTLRISRVGAATHGQVFLQPDGVLRFVPDVDYHGPASFTYWVADRDAAAMAQGLGLETPATAHLTILPVNDLPVAVGEALDSDEDVVLRIAPGLLLANDNDVDTATDGQRLSIVAVGEARHGSVSLAPDGSIVFVPEADYFGPASFRYTVDDDAGGRAETTAVLNLAPVNDAPNVLGETIDSDEDQTLTITQAALLANDSDVDNPASDLRIVAVEHAEHGSVRLDRTGDIVFVPDADYFGQAAFSYTVADGAGGFTIGRVALDIAPVNDAPRLLGEQVALDEDEVARFSPAALLANDMDVDNPHAALTIVSVGRAEHGSVLLKGGEVVFTPDRDYHGAARFSYTVSDGAGGSSDAWVDLNVRSVNDAPTVNGEQLTAKAGVAYTLTQAALLANDSDADGDVLRIVAVQGAQHGTVVLLADGSIRFAPEAGAGTGSSGSFEYVVEDSAGAQGIATARIDFSRANVAPVATDDSFVGHEDIPLVISAGQLLSNDSDVDNTAAQLRLAGVDNASHGSVSLDADGNVRFVADADYSGAASFRYRVVDGDGGESYATAYLQLAAVNDAPVIEDIWFGRPIYGYTYQNVQRYNELGQMVSDESGRLVTDYLLVDIDDESSAVSLLDQGKLYRPDGLTVADHLDRYRNGHLRPVAIDGDTRNLEYATVQTGVVVAYDPDGNSEKITFSLASTPQHGHAWANLYVPFFPPLPGSTSSIGDTQDFLMVPSISTAERGAWQYINVIGDLYTGADPFSMRVTDADGVSTVVSINTRHLGLHYLPHSGGWFPIAVDLGDDGVELVRPRDSNVFADLDGDGKTERLGWTAASDAMLVFDAEGDGSVDMVKDSDFARFGGPGATDLEGLAAFDSNGDGRISAADERWSRLGLVQDRNSDGRQDEGELRSLADLGVESIGLSRSGTPHEDHGNVVFGYTDVRWSDGHVSQAADVMLAGEGVALPQRVAQPAPPGAQAHVGAGEWASMQGDAVRTAMVFAQFLNTHAPVDMPGTFAVTDFGAGGSEALVVQGLIDAANDGATGFSRLHEAA